MSDTMTNANAYDIRAALKSLGLEPGAAVDDVHAAFRRLVRECHPDVAGREGAERFQEITGAYSLLKGLSPEALALSEDSVSYDVEESVDHERGNLFDWYSKRRRGQLDDSEDTETPRESSPLHRRVERVLDQYDRDISRRLEQLAKDATHGQVNGFLIRLRSSVPEVRAIALSKLGPIINNEKIHSALADLLCREDLAEETARTLYALPMSQETLRSIAGKVTERSPSLVTEMLKHSSPAVRLLSRSLLNAMGQPA